ncbi:MAG: glycosyltransferase [Muribaculaceae bacterium]|nr:glycosyltransferase [Muribaculaceae bacterium]
MPFFSIITVCFNAESTISPTLRSVAGQSFRDFEHIVQDGGSSDNTLRIIRELGSDTLSLVSQPDKGLYYAMNDALARATGEYVVFLNAGDTFHTPETLAMVHRAIKEYADGLPGVAYGQTVLVDAERNILGPRHLTAPDNLTFRSFSNGMVVCHQAFFARRDLAPQFNTSYRFSADYDWCIQILRKSPGNVYIDGTVIDYLHEGVTTANHKKSLRERFNIMCRYYGTIPTAFRHIRFLFRHLARYRQ